MYKFCKHIYLFICFFSIEFAFAQQYLPTTEEFGKNRIQYKNYNWKSLTTNNFEIYFYQDGQQTATLAAQYAEAEFERITDLLGYTPFSRTRIFVFNSVEDIKQSNIGLSVLEGEDAKEINLSKSRVLLAFNGNQVEFRKKLVRGIAGVFVYDMLYGGSLKETLQSSLLLTLPDWFMAGIESYIAEGWSEEMDNFMRDEAINKRLKKPTVLTGEEARLVGHSIWNFVTEAYGKDNISNILNLTRLIRNEQTSIASTLGISYSRFLKDWREFYNKQAEAITQSYVPLSPEIEIPGGDLDKGYRFRKVKLSPDLQYIAYSTNDYGRYSVEVFDTKSKKQSTILIGGYKSLTQPVNPNTPLISWQKNNTLSIIIEDNDKVALYQYSFDSKGGRKQKLRRLLKGFNQVTDFDVSDDGVNMVFSAEKKGQNDLFLYRISGNALQQLTNDLYDDLHPQFVGRSITQVVFTSNRINDTLKVDKGSYKSIRDSFSLFLHDGNPRAETVNRLVDSLGTISHPIAPNDNDFYFLSDEKGIRNLYKYSIADSSVIQLTNFNIDLLEFDLNAASGSLAYLAHNNTRELIGYRTKLDLNKRLTLPATQRSQTMNLPLSSRFSGALARLELAVPVATPKSVNKEPEKEKPSTEFQKNLETGEVDTDNYQFDVESFKTVERRAEKEKPTKNVTNIAPKVVRNRDNFKIKGPTDYQDIFLYNGSTGGLMVDPLPMRGIGWNMAVTMNDLLENHTLKAGLFITPNLRNSDLFAEYHYNPKRIDYGFRIDRRSLFTDYDGFTTKKYRFNKVALIASYPISESLRASVSPSYSLTRLVDLENIAIPDKVSDYAGAKAEVVFDNTITNGQNMLEGLRAKVQFDYYAGLKAASEGFTRLNVDIRHYKKIHRELILATRLAFTSSGGNAPKQTIMGGMDNWLFNSRDERKSNDPLNPTLNNDQRDLFFTNFATPLRGFNINKLSGTSSILLNVELRAPLVKYFYRGPITSNFLRNFQLVAFTDVGTAWTGKGPFNRQNSLNTEIVGGPPNPFKAAVTNFKNPFLIGYGAGARTILFGYYVKFDAAWGLENYEMQKPMMYLTLGYDF